MIEGYVLIRKFMRYNEMEFEKKFLNFNYGEVELALLGRMTMKDKLKNKLIQDVTCGPLNTIKERIEKTAEEFSNETSEMNFQEDITLSMLMEAVALAKAGKDWKPHITLLKHQLEKTPNLRRVIADCLAT